MQKFRILLIMIGLGSYLHIPVAYSQNFLNFGAKPTSSPQTTNVIIQPPGPPGSNPVVPPEDFKKLVNSLGEQNQANLSQQLKQQIASQPKSGPVTPPSSPIPVMEDRGPSKTAPTVTQTIPPQEVGAAPLPISTSTVPNVARSVPPREPPQPLPTQSQVYTGFGSPAQTTGGPTTNRQSPSSSSDTGWEIKY